MSLYQNINYTVPTQFNANKSNLAKIPSQNTTQSQIKPLSSPMIGRIHNVKPGCSSCGK